LLLGLRHGRRKVDAVVVAQVVEGDVLAHVLDAGLLQALDDGVAATADGVVLELHDGARAERVVGLEVAGESGDGWHGHDDFEGAPCAVCLQDTLDHGTAEFVDHRALLGRRGRDEEL
jgi:hypothetical protein